MPIDFVNITLPTTDCAGHWHRRALYFFAPLLFFNSVHVLSRHQVTLAAGMLALCRLPNSHLLGGRI